MEISLSCIWAKYSKNEQTIHPLIAHAIETAAVSNEILNHLSSPLPKELQSFILFLIALHDIGKATPGFQAKGPEKLIKKLEELDFDFPDSAASNHSLLGQYHLGFLLENELHMEEEDAAQWARMVTSHHGSIIELFPKEPVEGSQWQAYRKKLFERLIKLFQIDKPTMFSPKSSDAIYIMGLCSVADWIASNENYFPYHEKEIEDLELYWHQSLQKARTALEAIGFSRPAQKTDDFKALFGFETPNPLQKTALIQSQAHRQHPMLMIVEAPMGEGKTEAALGAYAVRENNKNGLYFALPTQATTNMIFPRIKSFLEHFVSMPTQLHLLHSNAMLNEEYHQLKIDAVYGRNDASVYASEWFLSKKRTLLASFGVGTVDQIEMAALQVRHFFVRLFALSGKTVIIDEVHAYDAYMSGILEMLLSWLAELGTTVILLSATLPKAKKEHLIAAYFGPSFIDELPAYPCVVSFSNHQVLAQTVEGLKTFEASIDPVPGESWVESMTRLMNEHLGDGGCAACIVNTVADAQTLYSELREFFAPDELILFHARFTVEERAEIEKKIVEKFGNNGRRPARAVVVATQVIEQSLDVDFDLMISQPAPIDLLLQRMGRLHRHARERPTKLRDRKLYVTVPPQIPKQKEDFGMSRFVYYPDILYKSLALLHEKGRWRERTVRFPDGLSDLVEQVYDTDPDENAIAAWQEEREGEEFAHDFLASQAAIPAPTDDMEAIDEIRFAFDDDPEAPRAKTRLGEPSVMLIVLPDEDAGEVETFSDAVTLYKRSVRVQNRGIVKHFENITTPEAWRKWPLIRHAKPFVEGSVEGISYDKQMGLIIERKENP